MDTGRRIDKLRRDAHPAASAPDTSLDDIARTQFLADIDQVDRALFEPKGGGAGDDQQVAEAG